MKKMVGILSVFALCGLTMTIVLAMAHSPRVAAQQIQDPAAEKQAKIKALKEQLAHPFENLEGKQASDFTLQTLDGQTIHAAQFKGKPFLLSFFRIKECQPCIDQLSTISAISRKYAKSNLTIVGVVKERAGLASTPEDIKNTLKSIGDPYPVAYASDSLTADYGNSKIVPYNVYVTSSGKIFRQAAGQDLNSMDRTIAELLRTK